MGSLHLLRPVAQPQLVGGGTSLGEGRTHGPRRCFGTGRVGLGDGPVS